MRFSSTTAQTLHRHTNSRMYSNNYELCNEGWHHSAAGLVPARVHKTSDFAGLARQKPIHYPPFITVSASPRAWSEFKFLSRLRQKFASPRCALSQPSAEMREIAICSCTLKISSLYTHAPDCRISFRIDIFFTSFETR